MYEFLLSADLMVPDPDATTAMLVSKLGILEHPNWRQDFADHAYVAHFLRVHKSLAVAPTRIEPQGHVPIDVPAADPFFSEYLANLADYQSPFRPMKTHATVLATRHLDEILERLMRRRMPFRIAPMDKHMSWERVWVGVTPENLRYSPVVDGGLCIELIGVDPLQMPPETFASPPPEPKDPEPGSMVRVVGRGFLVRDLDETLRLLSANMDWEPAGPVQLVAEEGYRVAHMQFALSHSASVDIIEPMQWNSDTGYYLHIWGPGPYYMRISVNGLDAKAEDLERRGTAFTWRPESSAVEGRRIQVDPADLDGQLVEFVEHRP
jgi:hypothetical protein